MLFPVVYLTISWQGLRADGSALYTGTTGLTAVMDKLPMSDLLYSSERRISALALGLRYGFMVLEPRAEHSNCWCTTVQAVGKEQART